MARQDTVDDPSTTRSVRVGAVDLNVRDVGSGPPILLLHGFPDSLAMWDGVTEHLVAAGHRVIAYDQRGFGDSSAPVSARNYAIDAIVADALAVLADAGVEEPVTVVGHDWGAIVSWALCLAHPDRVARHVAISVGHPTAYRSAGLEQKRRGLYVGGFQLVGVAERVLLARDAAVLRRWAASHPALEHAVTELSRPGRLTAGLNWYRRNLAAIFTRSWGVCSVPTLAIFGARDPYLTEEQMLGSQPHVSAAWEYVRVDGGHWLPLEQPERVAELVARWAAAGR